MSVEAILGTHRRPLVADVATLAACIDECAACAATCTICADACLAEPDVEALVRCIRLCLDCADACIDTGRIVSRQTEPDPDTQLRALDACLTACRACAAECERHAHHHEHCRLSAEECRRCERACANLLAAAGIRAARSSAATAGRPVRAMLGRCQRSPEVSVVAGSMSIPRGCRRVSTSPATFRCCLPDRRRIRRWSSGA